MKFSRCLILGLLAGIFLKLFVFDIRKIEGVSMLPTLKTGSLIIENKLAYGIIKPFSSTFFVQWKEPKTDDIVLYVQNGHVVIKRCVAVANQSMEFSEESGYILKVNGKNIPLTSEQFHKMQHSHQVPEGMILAVGDNYEESVDSREYGFVSTANVLSKAVCK
ncbi:MAG: signal peptidase I [Treponemataceae bacterium]|nr:signal peptidase I [Treponemataceae bacterium]